MKKKGFTLIELVVVVAIILLLAATLAPKLRKEVAKARDAKAVAALGAVRTAVNIYLTDEGDYARALQATASATGIIDTSGDSEYLEDNVITYLEEEGTAIAEDAVVKVGATRTSSTGDIVYGGTVTIDYVPTEVTVSLAGKTPTNGDYDTKGNTWASY
jgi:prepilin-type N-terminal cleavage/methylation domain-containing protein